MGDFTKIEELYISVDLDEYMKLLDIRDYLELLFDYGLEDWDKFKEATEEFLEEDGRNDPREL
jgi:hypothetical protein